MKNNDNSNQTTKLITDIFICLAVVLIVYFHTINRPWIFYDERVFFEELLAPIPSSFNEIFEIISSFGLAFNINSSNILYTSNTVNRLTFGTPIHLLVSYFFKNNAHFYHLLSLFFHLLNTTFVFLILNKVITDNSFYKRTIVIILSTIWALHPAHVESVLLASNYSALLTYSIFFLLFYDFIKNHDKSLSLIRKMILATVFLFAMLINEYIVALPLLLFIYSLLTYCQNLNFYQSLKLSWDKNNHYLISLAIYLFYFLFLSHKVSQPSTYNPLVLFIERIFWFSPQVFFHFIKLIFYPKLLSIDQTAFVNVSRALFSLHAVKSIVIWFLWLFLPLIFFVKNKKIYPLALTSTLFFISFLPFSQIPTPTYCLAAERYLYTPFFFIVFGIAVLLNNTSLGNKKLSRITLALCIIYMFFFGIRSYMRTNDWKDSFTLLHSTINSSPNNLYKGLRLGTLGEATIKFKSNEQEADKYFIKSKQYFLQAQQDFSDYQLNEPLILKSYSLDKLSLLIKNNYLITLDDFITNENDYLICLKRLEPYTKYFDNVDPKVLELYANLLIKANNPTGAKDIFLYAYKKYPTSPFILISLIRFERDIEHNLPATKEYLLKALKLYPYSKDILFESLRYYQAENNLKEYAKHAYLYGLRGHSVFTYSEALTGFLMLDDLEGAKKTVGKLLLMNSKEPRVLYLISSYFIRIKNYPDALSYLNQAYSLFKNNSTDLQLGFDITNALAKVKELTQE